MGKLRTPPTLLLRLGTVVPMVEMSASIGDTAAIQELLRFSLSEDDDLRRNARRTLHDLFKGVPVHEIPRFDDMLRRIWRYVDNWYNLREFLSAFRVSREEDLTFVRLIASHSSGYFREMALANLGEHVAAGNIPFIILRLNDWVDEVRSAAEIQLRRHLLPNFAETLVQCMPLIQRQRGASRFSMRCADEIDSFFQQPKAPHSVMNALERGMSSELPAVRRTCFRLAGGSSSFSREEVIGRAVLSPDVLVRKWGFVSASEHSKNWLPRLQGLACKDAHSPIRRLAFEAMANTSIEPEDFLPFLLDRSMALRKACQLLLQTRFGAAPPKLYRNLIRSIEGRSLATCILGLIETGSKDDAVLIAPLLTHSRAGVRVAAIRALRAFDDDGHTDVLIRAVAADTPSVAREAAFTLMKRRIVPAEVIWRKAVENRDVRVPLGVLGIARFASKWAQLPIYLAAINDADERVGGRALERLAQWVLHANDSFMKPSAEDAIHAWLLLQRAIPKVPPKLVQQLTFILETAL